MGERMIYTHAAIAAMVAASAFAAPPGIEIIDEEPRPDYRPPARHSPAVPRRGSSKYMPHQGTREQQRRLRQLARKAATEKDDGHGRG